MLRASALRAALHRLRRNRRPASPCIYLSRVVSESLEIRSLLSVSFALPTSYGPIIASQTFVIADLNNDHHPDAIVLGNLPDTSTTSPPTKIGVFINKGDGTFAAAIILPVDALSTIGVAVGDFNSDSVPDIVVASDGDGTIACYLGAAGNGGSLSLAFSAPVVTHYAAAQENPSPGKLAVGRFGSGDALVVTDTAGHNQIDILQSQDNGHFTPAIVAQNERATIAVINTDYPFGLGDFNGDGLSDLITQTLGGCEIDYGQVGGSFKQGATFSLPDPMITQVAVAPLESSSSHDLIVETTSNTGSSHLNVFDSADGGTAFYPIARSGQFFIGDFDGNKTNDILVATFAGELLYMPFSDLGSPLYKTFEQSDAAGDFRRSAAADFNGDGKLDLVSTSSVFEIEELSIFLNTTAAPSLPPAPTKFDLHGKVPPAVVAGRPAIITQAITIAANTFFPPGVIRATLYLTKVFNIEADSPLITSTSGRSHSKADTTLRFNIRSIPATTPNGTYHITMDLTDGSAHYFIRSADTITVTAPQVDLSGQFIVAPSVFVNVPTPIAFTIQNQGSIAARGLLSYSLTGAADANSSHPIQIATKRIAINLAPGKQIKVRTRVLLSADIRNLTITLDPDDVFKDPTRADNSFSSITS